MARQQRYEPTLDEDELVIPGPRLSVEAKRRIWWRNAFVNALYIASWWVPVCIAIFGMRSCLASTIGSSSPHYCRCTTNGCSRQTTSTFRSRYSSRRCIWPRSSSWLAQYARSGRTSSIRPGDLRCPSTCEPTTATPATSLTPSLIVRNASHVALPPASTSVSRISASRPSRYPCTVRIPHAHSARLI